MIVEQCSAWHNSIKFVLTVFETEKLLSGLRRNNPVHIKLRTELERILNGKKP